ncbi:hypothetical protein HN385_03245 [archaeon]|nr:hypothetical protein [archaeon]
MKTLPIILTILLFLPLASALDCSLTTEETYCESLTEYNLTDTELEQIYSILLYESTDYPNHDFIQEYNLDIEITEPVTNTTDSTYIKNAWLSILTVFPSVIENDIIYTPNITQVLSAYDYDVQLPSDYRASRYPYTSSGDCKRTNHLTVNDAQLSIYFNSIYQDNQELTELQIDSNGTIEVELQISTTVRTKHYEWDRYTRRCEYDDSTYSSDSLTLSDTLDIMYYNITPETNLTFTGEYWNISRGTFFASNYSQFQINFNNSSYTSQRNYYDLLFVHQPYYFAYLRANNYISETVQGMNVYNNIFTVSTPTECNLYAYNHFFELNTSCDLTIYEQELEQLTIEAHDIDFTILIYIITIILLFIILFKLGKSKFMFLLLFLLIIPTVHADDEECGITNLADCIPEKIYEYFLTIINAPILPMLSIIQDLLTVDIDIEVFETLWSVVRYVISFFYVFIFLYTGYVFLTNNSDPIKRAHAKELLRNLFIMIILIQGSFYLYDLTLDINSTMNSTLIEYVDEEFFLITVDSIVNVSLELVLGLTYAFTLLFTMILLMLRYILICLGVISLPIAIFCYFIPPLKPYGKFVLNMLGILIFVTTFDLLIILACSMMVDYALFDDFQILFMITAFSIVNASLIFGLMSAFKMSTEVSLKDDLRQAVKYMALVV